MLRHRVEERVQLEQSAESVDIEGTLDSLASKGFIEQSFGEGGQVEAWSFDGQTYTNPNEALKAYQVSDTFMDLVGISNGSSKTARDQNVLNLKVLTAILLPGVVKEIIGIAALAREGIRGTKSETLRHHGQHYHVEVRKDPFRSWNARGNIQKIKPEKYTKGEGTGFLPGEKFPGIKK